EKESNKLFRAGEKARSLRITFKSRWMHVLAFQFGSSFMVSARRTSEGAPDRSSVLYYLMALAFERIVEVATRDALRKLLESKNVAVPSGLSPEQVFDLTD